MKRLLFITILLLFKLEITFASEAVFSISEVNTEQFPLIRCSFVALDATGQSYKNLVPADFEVFERGRSMNPTLNVHCRDTNVEPAVSIILIVDQSSSMLLENEAKETRWSWVKIGVNAFVNTINFRTGTKVALISFGNFAYLRCKFTDNKQEIIDSLNNIMVGGGTLYNPPFLDPDHGAINLFLRGSPDPTKRRIIVFLTDGEPNKPPATDSIIKELQKINAQVYAITLAMPMHPSLDAISSRTGGRAYKVETKTELENIYRYIALDIQTKQLCQLTWITEYGCSDFDLLREIKVTFKRQGVTITRLYEAPPHSIAKLPIDQSIVDFFDPPPNQFTEVDIKLTSPIDNYVINEILTVPSTYYQIVNWDVGGSGGPPPFTLMKDQTRTIRVRFTQGSTRQYRESTLMINGKPCPANVKLIGGISQVRILSPNGGEVFSVCDTVNIIWSGVEADKPVNLFYSSDGGNTWRTIVANARGLSYRWIPPVGGNTYRIRATVAPVSSYIWAKGFGGSEDDFGRSIAVTEDNSYIFITGSFSGIIDLENNKRLVSAGGLDIFVAKFDRDGNLIWAQSAGGPGTDTAAGIFLDKAGNAYITGTCHQGATFGFISPTIPVPNTPYCFVARYPGSGASPIVTLIGATQTYSSFKAWGQKIKYKTNEPPNTDDVIVLGEYLNQIQTVNYTLPKVTVPTTFTAVFNPDLTVRFVQKDGIDDGTFSKSVAFDGVGDRYEVGSFTGNLTSGSIVISSKGKNDVFIRRFGGSPGSEDISDTNFAVQNPVWTLKSTSYDMGETTLGQPLSISIDAFICNIGKVPIVVRNTQIIGANSTDFSLGFQLVGRKLSSGECLPIELVFDPKDIGPRSAQLIITPDCGTQLVLNLSGFGVCAGESISKVDMGSANLNVKVTQLVKCIFRNPNPSSVQVRFVISGPNASDFSLPITGLFVKPNECVDLEISFVPTGAGRRQAVLKFELPPGCTSPETELVGNGIDADIVVYSIDWQGRRLMTVNDTNLVIYNRSTIPQKLIELRFEDNVQQFSFVNNPPVSLPLTIPSGESIGIPIRFIPDQENSFTNTVIAKFEGISNELLANVRGDGILPKIELSWTCFDAVKPGERGLAELRVTNPSTTADLVIHKMDFKYKTGDFNWANGAPVNEIIPKSTSKSYDVIFTPQTPGTRADLIEITHDAAPGPDPQPRVDTTFDAECDGLGLTAISSINFGNSLLCEDNIYEVKIINDSWVTPVTLLSYNFANNNNENFRVLEQFPIVISPSNFVTLKIKFTPTEAKDYEDNLTIKTSIDYDINIKLSGKGVYVDFYSETPELRLQPLFSRKVTVKARVPKLYNQTISLLDLNFYFNEKMLRIDNIIPSSGLRNWTWEDPIQVAKNNVKLRGSGSLTTPFDIELFTIDFTVFLGDVKESNITVEMRNNGCLYPGDVVTKIILSNVCFVDGRLIVVSDKTYFISPPEPNPITSNFFNLKFGIAFDDFVDIQVYNLFGELISQVFYEALPAGSYNLALDASRFENGVYYIRMKSGSFYKVVPFVVAR